MPVAQDDGIFATRGEVPIKITIEKLLSNDSDPDGDALQLVGLGDAANGTVSLLANGRVQYIADSGFTGEDQFLYQITDGTSVASATVTVNVDEPYADIETGDKGDNVLIGDFTGDSYLFGGAGDDTLISGRGDDLLIGGSGSDWLYAGGGDDVLRAGSGDDVLLGAGGNDKLNGGSGDDVLFGGRGEDRIAGGKGDDVLFGGRGSDTFIFKSGDGSDYIADYQPGRSGRRFSIAGDELRISVAGISDFDDLLAVGQNEWGGVRFDFGDGDELFLSGTRLAALDEDSFSFF